MIANEQFISPEMKKQAEWLVNETACNNGLVPVDCEVFWRDDAIAHKDPFGKEILQVPLGIRMSWETIFAELSIPEDTWRYLNDSEWALGLNRAYNDKAEKIVGLRLLDESIPDKRMEYPVVKGLHDIFESHQIWKSGSWWLERSLHGEDELARLLDRVEKRDIRSFILPPDWEREKERLMKLGIKPRPYRSQRGPVTFAMSIYGIEDLIFLIQDNPDLASRFRDAICHSMIGIAEALDHEARTCEAGFSFFDDNCAMLNREMYKFFGFPVLKKIFERFAPNSGDPRFQHSDSAMGHLLPDLAELDFSAVNFGPSIPAVEIRKFMPRTVIQGQLAPFTFSNNDEKGLALEFLRDFGMLRETRGLLFTTAGSVNNGSRLTGMRLVMSAIQHFGRY